MVKTVGQRVGRNPALMRLLRVREAEASCAAALAAYRTLRASGFFKLEDNVVLFNTGTGLKYLDVLDSIAINGAPDALVRGAAPQRPTPRQIGGIIGPY